MIRQDLNKLMNMNESTALRDAGTASAVCL